MLFPVTRSLKRCRLFECSAGRKKLIFHQAACIGATNRVMVLIRAIKSIILCSADKRVCLKIEQKISIDSFDFHVFMSTLDGTMTWKVF